MKKGSKFFQLDFEIQNELNRLVLEHEKMLFMNNHANFGGEEDIFCKYTILKNERDQKLNKQRLVRVAAEAAWEDHLARENKNQKECRGEKEDKKFYAS